MGIRKLFLPVVANRVKTQEIFGFSHTVPIEELRFTLHSPPGTLRQEKESMGTGTRPAAWTAACAQATTPLLLSHQPCGHQHARPGLTPGMIWGGSSTYTPQGPPNHAGISVLGLLCNVMVTPAQPAGMPACPNALRLHTSLSAPSKAPTSTNISTSLWNPAAPLPMGFHGCVTSMHEYLPPGKGHAFCCSWGKMCEYCQQPRNHHHPRVIFINKRSPFCVGRLGTRC